MILETLANKFGQLGGWNNVTVNLLGRDLEGITELEYDDSQEIENVYGAGKMPIGQGEGNYAAKAAITLLIEEKMALQAQLPAGKRLSDLLFDAVVEYDYEGTLYKDIIRNCRIMDNGVAVKQGDKTIATKHNIVCTHISWGV